MTHLARVAAEQQSARLLLRLVSHDALERRTVWTDGVCVRLCDPMLQRAGWGVRVDGLKECNWGGPVSGRETAQRAELAAALASNHGGRPVSISSSTPPNDHMSALRPQLAPRMCSGLIQFAALSRGRRGSRFDGKDALVKQART